MRVLDQSGGEAGVAKSGVGRVCFFGQVLGYREALVGVDPDPLGVADQHVEHLLGVADLLQVVTEVEGLSAGDKLDPWPQLRGGGVGAALLIGPADEGGRSGMDASLVEQFVREGDVLPGVGRMRLDEDSVLGDASGRASSA